jgi:hypothetical protein
MSDFPEALSPGDEQERVRALLPLAESLRESIDRQLAGTVSEGVDVDMDQVFTTAFTAVAELIIADRIKDLSSREVAELYARVRGNEMLAQKLDAIEVIHRDEAERELLLLQIALEARISRSLHLTNLRPQETLSLGLFGADKPQVAGHRFAKDGSVRSLHRLLVVRLIDPDEGQVEILSDTWVGPTWALESKTNALPTHQVGQLGTELAVGNDTSFEPVLSAQSHFAYRSGVDQQTTVPPQIIGYIETGDGRILLDGAN